MDVEKLIENGWDITIKHGPNLILALVVLFVGLFAIKKVTFFTSKMMEKNELDVSLIPFLTSLVNIGLKVLLVISVAGMINIQTTSFIAVLGAMGLAIGLALQGTLANFAGGVLILILKPFKVGDFIEAQAEMGDVKEIHIFYTVIISPQNKKVIIPNGALSNGTIKNYTEEGKRRVDLTMGISYDSNIQDARNALIKVMEADPKVLKDPAPFVGVSALADSSVNLAVRPYATPDDYWDVYFGIMEKGKLALEEAGITIPFPQVDVHMQNAK